MKVKVETEVELIQKFVIRGVVVRPNGRKEVVAESDYTTIPPMHEDVARFLVKHPEVTFAVVESVYMI